MYLAAAQVAVTAALLSHHGTVTVRPGDTLSGIAAADCGTPAAYPALAAASGITNPDLIWPGQRITLACTGPRAATTAAYTGRHAAYAGRHRASGGKVWGVTYGYPNRCGDGDGDGWDVPCAARHADPPATGRHARSGSFRGAGSSFEACVIARESGGNAQVMNPFGHYGLYQFSATTWAAYGGDPALFGHASPAYQQRIFDNAIAQGGQSNWSPYDGC